MGRGEGISGEKGEGFAGTIIKDTWTILGGVEMGGRGEGLGVWAGVGGKGRKLYLNNFFKNQFLCNCKHFPLKKLPVTTNRGCIT